MLHCPCTQTPPSSASAKFDEFLGLSSPSKRVDDQVPTDIAAWVDSLFASGSTSPSPKPASALAGVDGDVDALVGIRQLDVCSHKNSQINVPTERDMAVEDAQSFAPSPAISPEPTTQNKARQERKNGYNSREQKINRELLALLEERKVELWFGEHGIAGEKIVSAVRSSQWGEVIDRLNRSINGQSKPGTPSENLAQCLRDCGVVPKTAAGKVKKNWTQPVD
eukprot:60156-Rhodomonas_salina.3